MPALRVLRSAHCKGYHARNPHYRGNYAYYYLFHRFDLFALLERPHEHALPEMFFNHRVNNQYGERGNYYRRELYLRGRPHLFEHDFAFAARVGVEQSVEHRLQGVKLFIDAEYVCVDIVVPVAHGVEKYHYRDYGFRHGKDEVEERPYFAGAVYHSRFEHLFGHVRLEERFAHKHVVHADAAAYYENERVLIEPERAAQNYVGHQPAAEEHRDDEYGHYNLAERKIIARERPARGNGEHHVECRAEHRVCERVEVSAPDIVAVEQLREARKGDVYRI